MAKAILKFSAGMAVILWIATSVAGAKPQPLPQEGAKVYPRIHMEDVGEVPVIGQRWDVLIESSFKAQLDQLYRQHMPPVRHLQFVENQPNMAYDLIIYGTYAGRAYGKSGLHVTMTLENQHTGATQSFAAEGELAKAMQVLAQDVFHEYQQTRFPQQIDMFGRKLLLLFKGVISGSGEVRMAELYKRALLACEMRGGRISTEKELVALGTLGDYGGGVSVGHNGVATYYWAVESGRVYVAPWSQSTSATSLNPTEQLNYLCVR